MSNLSYIIWGSSGHTKVINEVIESQGNHVVALFDNSPITRSVIPGVPIYYGKDEFIKWAKKTPEIKKLVFSLAIGGSRGRDRMDLMSFLVEMGLSAPPIIHTTAAISISAKIGAGCHILANTVVAAGVQIGDVCIINNGANVDHECILGSGVHLAPGSILCGCVSVGDGTLIGAGAIVLPRVKIGSDVIIGAGAVVTKDVSDGLVLVGNPARLIRK